jgi:hypothetical protein
MIYSLQRTSANAMSLTPRNPMLEKLRPDLFPRRSFKRKRQLGSKGRLYTPLPWD